MKSSSGAMFQTCRDTFSGAPASSVHYRGRHLKLSESQVGFVIARSPADLQGFDRLRVAAQSVLSLYTVCNAGPVTHSVMLLLCRCV